MSQLEPIAAGTPFHFGKHTFHFGNEVEELRDSSGIVNDVPALLEALQTDGYLFIRGFHHHILAQAAANWTLDAISKLGGLAEGSAVEQGLIGPANRNYPFFRQVAVAHAPAILDVVNSASTFAFFERLFSKPVLTFDKRWLRCMATGGHNHFHYDSVYVGRGTPNRYTMWSALTNTDIDEGPLVLCLGSHRHQRLKQTYGAMDMDRDLTEAVFTDDPKELIDDFGFKLATCHFEPGDVVIFGMYMMHSSAPNLSPRYRISIDTRYQPADEATDERFFGEHGNWLGNFYNKGATYTPMHELREKWQL
jgi:hypothetical protein